MYGNNNNAIFGYIDKYKGIDTINFSGGNFSLDANNNTIESNTYITMTAPDGVSINQTNNSGYDLNTGTINCSSIDVNGTTLSTDLGTITAQIHWIKDGSNNLYNNNTGNVLVNNVLDLQNNNITNVNTITALDLAGTLTTASQPNITSLGIQALDLDMGGKNITNCADPTTAQQVATKNYVDTHAGDALPLSGGTMTGSIDLANHYLYSANEITFYNGTQLSNTSPNFVIDTNTKTPSQSTKLQLIYDVNNTSCNLRLGQTDNTDYYALNNKSNTTLDFVYYNGTAESKFMDLNSTNNQINIWEKIDFNNNQLVGINYITNNGSSAIGVYDNLDMKSNGNIINCLDPVNNQDVATKAYVDTHAGDALPLSGGTMTGNIDMNNNSISNVNSLNAYSGNSNIININGRLHLNSSGNATPQLLMQGTGTNSGGFHYEFSPNTSWTNGNLIFEKSEVLDNTSALQPVENIYRYIDQTSNETHYEEQNIQNMYYSSLKQMVLGSNTYDSSTSTKLNIVGGNINMNNNNISNINTISGNSTDIITSNLISCATAPTSANHLVNKNYVDTALGSGSSYFNGQVHCSNTSGTSYIYLGLPDGYTGTYELYWATIFFSPTPSTYKSTNLFFNITGEDYSSILSLATGAANPHPYVDTANSVLEPQTAKTIITTFEINSTYNSMTAGYGFFVVVSNSTGQVSDININYQLKKI